MKRLLIMASMATLLATAWPGHAQQPPPGGGRRGMEPPMRPMPPPQREQMPPRDFRGDRDGQDPRRGHLSPEERRQLRRDIGDHGRDVYRDRRPPQR
ncbi:MAG: hypothetical protein ACM36B_06085 [Bacteroidota bacterium]|jgi:hypothetical protein